jgi:hypothetical protein
MPAPRRRARNDRSSHSQLHESRRGWRSVGRCRVEVALMVRPPHQRIEDARQYCAFDDRSAVADVDTDMRGVASHHHPHWSALCPIPERRGAP